jgi:hypothetical protein
MPKYTSLLTPTEYEQLTTDEKVEYILDMAEVLKATHQTPKTGIPLRKPPDEPKDKDN